MKKKLLILNLCLIILCGYITSCLNSMDDLTGSYNKNFTVTAIEGEDVLKPGDEGFDENTMLYDEYFVYNDGTLNLAAPKDCYNYTWILRDPEYDYSVVQIAKFWEGSGTNTREFIIYIPESGLEAKTYQLSLTLYDKEGNAYTDVCGLIVYNHYEYISETIDSG